MARVEAAIRQLESVATAQVFLAAFERLGQLGVRRLELDHLVEDLPDSKWQQTAMRHGDRTAIEQILDA